MAKYSVKDADTGLNGETFNSLEALTVHLVEAATPEYRAKVLCWVKRGEPTLRIQNGQDDDEIWTRHN